MMPRSVFRLVLLISCAHALVHVFELSLPAVEQLIGGDFGVGRDVMGMLGLTWRVPFGLGAVGAGWLADRYGSKRLLLIFLFGCAAMSAATYFSTTLAVIFAGMFAMGCFASIYHPAGLALISRATSPANRSAALGWHGIIGSLGIAGGPLLAGVVLAFPGAGWHDYYLVLAVPAVVLGIGLAFILRTDSTASNTTPSASGEDAFEETASWRSFVLLVAAGSMMGIVYSGFIYFLPRFLNESGISFGTDGGSSRPRPVGDYLAGLVLLCAVVGQGFAGRIARHDRLESFLAGILIANAPLLLWMAFATGVERLFAACATALVHFMHQPVYNSLVAKYVPHARRSLGYGISNTLGFGLGALGPAFAGVMPTYRLIYGGLAVVVSIAAAFAIALKVTAARPRQAEATPAISSRPY